MQGAAAKGFTVKTELSLLEEFLKDQNDVY